MLRKQLNVIAIALLITLSSIAQAGPGCQKKVNLIVTASGAARDISGRAEVRSDGARQRFKLSMDARVAAGTVYSVFANGVLASTVIIDALGNGELELSNENGRLLPASLNPVCAVSLVEVKDTNGVVVLYGSL